MAIIKLEKFIKAPPSDVYLYFTNSTALRDWLCDVATTSPQVGGRIYLCWNSGYYTSGEFLKLDQDRLISFSWLGRAEPHPTEVEVKLQRKQKGTQLRLTHRKLGKSIKWVAIGDEYQKQWAKFLDNLASVLENGADLRITTRPMLGIFTDVFNADVARQFGMPVSQGVRISGVVDGLGAQKAGLIASDVIVGLDDQEITGGESFGSYIGGKKAGDVVEVTFYRGAEMRQIQMTLSGRPIPPIPASGSELAKQVEPTYKHYEGELETVLKNATEEECSRKPAPSEWSANEVLAHLIHGERGWQNFVSEIIGGNEGAYDGFGGNIQAYIEGTVSTFQSKDALFQELKKHDRETLNLYAHVPTDFIKHKGKFWKLAFQASQNPYHLQTHLEQISSAIQAARNQ
jgi:uncharacterized protein YndB with AHSA1/START domain